MIPKIRLSDLLIEVDSWTQFSQEFIHDSTGNPPNEREKKIVFATLLGLGMNIGLEKMAQSTPELLILNWRILNNGGFIKKP